LGQLNLTGSAKETIIINGVNYFPFQIQPALDDIPGAKPNYTAAFAHRPKGSQTESVCVVYNPNYDTDDIDKRVKANDAITKAVMLQTGCKPYTVPLDSKMLQKTTLGKLSHAKIQKAFEKGEYEKYQTLNDEAIASHPAANYE
jgi:phenylacetate-coenzyme A ligase PaaK-like adenylate-forming protein